MQQKIKELYEQAAGTYYRFDFEPKIAEEFAKLIILECANIVEDDGNAALALKIKRYFGVE